MDRWVDQQKLPMALLLILDRKVNDKKFKNTETGDNYIQPYELQESKNKDKFA